MDNIKRCEWCVKEYDINQFDINNPRVFLNSIDDQDCLMDLCSLECMEAVVTDRLEDKKYERNAPLSARQKVK